MLSFGDLVSRHVAGCNKNTGIKLITFHGDLPYPSFEIIEKLESLDDKDKVGSGGFGTIYRM
ncbi:hypothetical protein Droror1_Dr00027963, partial [Drosera rotundifolia]